MPFNRNSRDLKRQLIKRLDDVTTPNAEMFYIAWPCSDGSWAVYPDDAEGRPDLKAKPLFEGTTIEALEASVHRINPKAAGLVMDIPHNTDVDTELRREVD